MMAFSSLTELNRLNQTHPAHPVIAMLAHGLFSDTQPVTVALMEPHDIDHPLTDLCDAEDVILEGIIEQENMFLVALETDYGYGIVLAIPNEDWVSGHLRLCIEENLYN